jgi:hypothetical protein
LQSQHQLKEVFYYFNSIFQKKRLLNIYLRIVVIVTFEQTPPPTPTSETTAEPTAIPTIDPTAEPTAEPTPTPTSILLVELNIEKKVTFEYLASHCSHSNF